MYDVIHEDPLKFEANPIKKYVCFVLIEEANELHKYFTFLTLQFCFLTFQFCFEIFGPFVCLKIRLDL